MKTLSNILAAVYYFFTPAQAFAVVSILAAFIWALVTQDLSKLAE